MNRLRRTTGPGLLQRAGHALREWPGWFVLAAGAVLCVLGWYGVSGERLAARQLPYLASATVPGAALVVAGAVLIAARTSGRGGESADRRTDQLLTLLVGETAAAGEAAGPAGDSGPPVALPDGTLYHRADCPLVAGKATARAVEAAAVRERGLTACPVCEPEPPGGAGDGGAGSGEVGSGGVGNGGVGNGGAGDGGAGSGEVGSGEVGSGGAGSGGVGNGGEGSGGAGEAGSGDGAVGDGEAEHGRSADGGAADGSGKPGAAGGEGEPWAPGGAGG